MYIRRHRSTSYPVFLRGSRSAADVRPVPRAQVRGSTTPVEEQAYILRHSRSSGLIVQVHPSCQLRYRMLLSQSDLAF
jgi:hypothetical protein